MGLVYTESHEWARLEDNDIVVVGMSDYAVKEVGDIVFVEFEDEDDVSKGAAFAVLETVKAVFDLYAPVSGSIVERNTILENDPSSLQNDPLDSGWIVKIRLSDRSEFDGLMSEDAYQAFISKNT